MRIAVSGSHRVGKSTLIEALAGALPRHVCVDEPYHLLEEDGYEASDPPSVEDFEAQLARALDALAEEDGPDVIFDRCPLDPIAYLRALDADAELSRRVRDALATLDLIVHVPIEEPDRIAVPRHEDLELRAAVADHLRVLLDEVDVPIVEVTGDLGARLAALRARVRAW